MSVPIGGSYDVLYKGCLEAEVVVDRFFSNKYIWIYPTENVVKVLCSSTNKSEAQKIVDSHNIIINSPLAKVMREI